jgi:site-specific recombinase XerD
MKISPDFEYYDIQEDYFNQFDAKDYNSIKETVKKQLMKKIEASDLKANAKNRLLSELSKFYILTNSLGWTLKYNTNPVNGLNELNNLEGVLD